MTQLTQTLTLVDMTMIAIGATIGCGILLTPAIIAQLLPVPWLFLALAGASVFVLRIRRPGAERPFRVPGVPIYFYWRWRNR